MKTVTKGASRAKRLVKSGTRDIRHAKKSAHRKARRTTKQQVTNGKEDEVFEQPLVTGWDIA